MFLFHVPFIFFYKHDHQCLPCLHAVSPAGTADRPAPPKPRRSPAREPPELVLPPIPSSPHIEPTESNSPQSPVEAEDEAPQCRFQMDRVSLSFALGFFLSFPRSCSPGFLTQITFVPLRVCIFAPIFHCRSCWCMWMLNSALTHAFHLTLSISNPGQLSC